LFSDAALIGIDTVIQRLESLIRAFCGQKIPADELLFRPSACVTLMNRYMWSVDLNKVLGKRVLPTFMVIGDCVRPCGSTEWSVEREAREPSRNSVIEHNNRTHTIEMKTPADAFNIRAVLAAK
jgi:hypothetical protein